PYFYSTYEQENEASPLVGPKAVILGSGPIRIGQGIEFDCCCVQSAAALRERGVAPIMVNSNPETVSTDFDASARLYFDPLDEESIASVLENEGPGPIAVLAQFGRQTALNLAHRLAATGGGSAGTSADAIALAEDRRLSQGSWSASTGRAYNPPATTRCIPHRTASPASAARALPSRRASRKRYRSRPC